MKLLNDCALDVLQCDGASTLNDIAKVAKHRGGCHSHARSKLVEALNRGDSRAIPALLLYTRLFAIEAESKASGEDFDARLARRIVRSRPLIQELWAWVNEMRPRIEPRSPLGESLTYLTRQRVTLEEFLADGRVAMTNNARGSGRKTAPIEGVIALELPARAADARPQPQDVAVLRKRAERETHGRRADDRAHVQAARRRSASVSALRDPSHPRGRARRHSAVAGELCGAAGEAEGCMKVADRTCVALKSSDGEQGAGDFHHRYSRAQD